jgi:hypothetical protein
MSYTTDMSSREKAAWLQKANPYKQKYLWDAFREGARAYWAGLGTDVHGLNSRERAAYWKGYDAAGEEA